MVGKGEGWTMSQDVTLCNSGLITASALTYAMICLVPHCAIAGLVLPYLSISSRRRHIMQLWAHLKSADGIIGTIQESLSIPFCNQGPHAVPVPGRGC